MSPAILRIIDYFGCIILVFHTKELSITLLRWWIRWLKDSALPVEPPPSGSLWLQNCAGLSWGTTGFYNEEIDPFSVIAWPPRYEVWFQPGTKWLVVDSGESCRDDWWWMDVVEIKGEQTGNKVRIFANRHMMQEWRRESGRMLRLDG